MSSFTKKYNDEEMNAALGALLIGGECLETGIYCLFKETGFFANNRRIITGYAGITDMGRFVCCRYGVINDMASAYNMEDIVQIKIKSMLFGQKMITLVFNDGKKHTVKFQLAAKAVSSKLPNQERNAEKMLEILEAKQNKLS